MPTFKKPMDATKHDFPRNKLFTEADNETNQFAAKYDLTSIQDGRSVNLEGQMDTIEENVRSKQSQILSNPQVRTSMTTNIRNIMRNQDKGLLTTSTRLLNASVRN